MCGICGIYNLDSKDIVDKTGLEAMTHSLFHRGPDDTGIYISGNVGLGHRRLSIIDKTSLAHQPFSNENDTIWVVMNGEIYNYMNLRQELKQCNHVFKSKSDTEVLVHLYEEFGESFIGKLRGMFAFALWDENKKLLLIARDRVGQKPLVYTEKGNILYFASEIKALRNISGVGDEVCNNSILLYFSFKLSIGEQTIYQDIKRLLPGKYMLIKDRKMQIKTYWHPSKFDRVNIDYEQTDKQLLSLLEQSVKYQMISDVPIGAFLSGGMDSSAIVGIMSACVKSPIKTFSVVHNDTNDHDSFFAKKASKYFKTEHKQIYFNSSWIDSLEEIVFHIDEPYTNPALLSFYFLCKEAKRDVTVVLSGDGGDEVFAGYSGYSNWKIIDAFGRWLGISGMLNIDSAVIKRKILSDSNISEITKMGLLLLVSSRQKRGLRRMFQNKQTTSKLFTNKIKDNIDYGVENKLLEKAFVEFNRADFIDNLQLTDLLLHNSHGITWMPDQIGMAHSLEIRAPFLDHKLIEFAFSLPSSMRLKGVNNRKYILKKSLRNFLPDFILKRKKMGYGESIPYKHLFKNEWNSYAQKKLFNGVLEEWGGINMNQLSKLYSDNLSDFKDNFDVLWTVMILSIWLERAYYKEAPAEQGLQF